MGSEMCIRDSNPATGEPVGLVADARSSSIDVAIQAAAQAFPAWSGTAPVDRAERLRAWADLIEENTEQVAAIATAESGKLFREARGEVGAGVAAIRWAAQVAEDGVQEDLPSPSPTRRLYTTKQAVGVVACITPCLLYTSPSPRDLSTSRMPSSA